MVGPGADLSGTDLTGLDLSGYDLSGADLSNANITETELLGTILSNANLANVTRYGLDGINMERISALEQRAEQQDTTMQQQETRIATLEASLANMNAQLQQLAAQIPQLQAAITDKDAQIAELSERPTLEEVQDARLGSAVIVKDLDSNEVTLNFSLEKSEDLQTWVPFEDGTWEEVADGEVKLTLPLDEAKKLLRVTLKG